MKKLIRKAEVVPKSTVRATGLTDLFCSPKLDAIDRSLASTFRKLAGAL